MNNLTTLTAEERRRVLEEYLDAVFADQSNPVADRLRAGAPELPDDPTAEQIAAWVELVALLRDPDYIESSRRMADQALTEEIEPDGGHDLAAAVSEHAGAAVRAGIGPDSPEALAVIECIEALIPEDHFDRVQLADRLETFTDRRVFRYWTLVGIVNAWPPDRFVREETAEAWEWYAQALRAHAEI